MADDFPRDLPHIYLPGNGAAQDYTARSNQITEPPLPARNRQAHAERLTRELRAAVQAGEQQIAQRDSAIAGGTPGFYLEFELPETEARILDRLEKREKKFPIELATVRPLPEGRLRRRCLSRKSTATTI